MLEVTESPSMRSRTHITGLIYLARQDIDNDLLDVMQKVITSKKDQL